MPDTTRAGTNREYENLDSWSQAFSTPTSKLEGFRTLYADGAFDVSVASGQCV